MTSRSKLIAVFSEHFNIALFEGGSCKVQILEKLDFTERTMQQAVDPSCME